MNSPDFYPNLTNLFYANADFLYKCWEEGE